MKVLFLTPYPTEGASNRFRVEQYLPYLRDEGISYHLRPFVSSAFFGILYQRGRILRKAAYFLLATLRRMGDVIRALFADVVFIHREAYPLGPPIFEWFIYILRRPIIYDFDDAIFLPSSSSPNTFIERFKWPSKVASIVRWSSWVIAGNDYLAAFARQFNDQVTVIPSCIETTTYGPRPKEAASTDKVVVGWIGSMTTQGFLVIMDDVYRELADRYPNLEFCHVGGFHTVPGLEDRIVHRPWRLEGELEELHAFDIGIMPLPDTPWTRGKCGFKAIQYMTVGVPAVCSPVGINAKIVDHDQNGYLAEDTKDWVEALGRLIEDETLRQRIGEAGRKKVEAQYSIERWAPNFRQVLKESSGMLKRRAVTQDPSSLKEGLFDQTVRDPEILHNEEIICFSSIDWDFIWQMPQEITARLADNGNRVLYVENTGVRNPHVRDARRLWQRFKNWKASRYGIRRVRANVAVYSPLVLPFPYSSLVRRLNSFFMRRTIRRWVRLVGVTKPIVLTFLPTGLTLDVIRAIDHRLLIYYCVDNFAASSKGARRIVKTEEELVREADLVLATSRELKERLMGVRTEVHQYPSGVSLEPFVAEREQPGQDPVECPQPRIGYVGGLHRWIDWPLLEETISASPEWSFVFLGPVQCEEAKQIAVYPNVFLLGAKPHDQLPRYIGTFDVCLIPYQVNTYTDNVYPVKMNEYLAMGKPVISTPMREVKGFNEEHGPLIVLADTPEAFRGAIATQLARDNGVQVQERYSAAEANSYVSRLRRISALIEERTLERLKQQERQWTMWETVRRGWWTRWQTLAIAMVALIYSVFFYTQLPWAIGAPLKISQPPKKSDAIVVLGGGVGETGVFGESTFERTRFGVKLYQQGYAPYLIFSTGFAYEYKEAEDMMLIAMSLNVPRDKIIMESRSRGTYQNVRYIAEILRGRGIDEIILVSAPYHMQRCRLLFSVYPNIRVTYTPAPSAFYGSGGRMTLRQLRALLWEYAAIIYYKYQGYF